MATELSQLSNDINYDEYSFFICTYNIKNNEYNASLKLFNTEYKYILKFETISDLHFSVKKQYNSIINLIFLAVKKNKTPRSILHGKVLSFLNNNNKYNITNSDNIIVISQFNYLVLNSENSLRYYDNFEINFTIQDYSDLTNKKDNTKSLDKTELKDEMEKYLFVSHFQMDLSKDYLNKILFNQSSQQF